MKNSDNQSLLSIVTPPHGGPALAAFLRAATKAIGGRSDADLAKACGVAASSVANWKRRGTVADSAKGWFLERLIPSIGAHSDEQLPRVELTAVDAVLHAIGEAGGNAVGARRDAPYANALALGAMLAWSQFAVEVLRINGHDTSFGDARVRTVVASGIAKLISAPPLELFR